MTFDEFDAYTEVMLKQVRHMRDSKGKEYANSEDRFDNFNRLERRLQQDRLKIALVYFTKHLDSIESYVRNGRTYSNEGIQGRIVDAITYLLLIGGMIEEVKVKVESVEDTTFDFKKHQENVKNAKE
jgi:hypothetical protein